MQPQSGGDGDDVAVLEDLEDFIDPDATKLHGGDDVAILEDLDDFIPWSIEIFIPCNLNAAQLVDWHLLPQKQQMVLFKMQLET